MREAFLYHSSKENYSNMLYNIVVIIGIIFLWLAIIIHRGLIILLPDDSQDEALKIALIIAGVTTVAVLIVLGVKSLLNL